MKWTWILPGALALTITAPPPTAIAEDELEVTMEVLDDLSGFDGDVVIPEGPREDNYEDDVFDLDNDGIPDDQEDGSGLFDRYTELGDDFEVEEENDGFEYDDEALTAEREFDGESRLEEGEDVDTDEFDEIEEVTVLDGTVAGDLVTDEAPETI